MSKSLEELQAYRARLESDVRRAHGVGGPAALNRNSPLIKNLENVKVEIANYKPAQTTSEVISE